MRIALALNHLIQCPSEDVIPAVQTRLHGLLSHKSCAIPLLLVTDSLNHVSKAQYTQTSLACCSCSGEL
jgi:hypothetical protein